jgi:ParB family chromosome partitioning protein
VTESNARLLEPHELAELGPPEAVRLPLDLVDPSPNNPRRALAQIEELADSISDPKIGLLQPIAVRRMGDRYEVIAGHRRRAAYLLLQERQPFEVKWRTIPAVIRTMDDEDSYLALVSAQVHNRNWNAREEASALERLAETRTLKVVGALVHRSEAWVGKRLKIYADAVLSAFVQTGRLPASIAVELLQIPDVETKRQYAERAVAEDWSQQHARGEVRRLKTDLQIRQLDRDVLKLLDTLSAVEASRIPIEAFRNLQVLRGRIEKLSETARGGPIIPTIAAAQKAARVNPDRPAKQRRTRLRVD